jgi:small nuclear ribonucleoprotein
VKKGIYRLEKFFIKLLYGKAVVVLSCGIFMESIKLEPSKKPLNVLTKQLNAHVVITLKNGVEYKGRMTRCDGHMNIMLDGASECMKDKLIANYGTVLVRGNNVLYIALDLGRGK